NLLGIVPRSLGETGRVTVRRRVLLGPTSARRRGLVIVFLLLAFSQLLFNFDTTPAGAHPFGPTASATKPATVTPTRTPTRPMTTLQPPTPITTARTPATRPPTRTELRPPTAPPTSSLPSVLIPFDRTSSGSLPVIVAGLSVAPVLNRIYVGGGPDDNPQTFV